MAKKRYQVFISSTYRDLTEERAIVHQAISKAGHIPAGMELFTATTVPPRDLIERVITDSDYYVLIVAGRYGSVIKEEGISYTEMEYDLALKREIPVLAFLHGNPEQLTVEKTDMSKAAQKKLSAFRARIQKSHHCVYWESDQQLGTEVIAALTLIIEDHPGVGWVRGDFAISHTTLLERYADLQHKYDEVEGELKSLKQLPRGFTTDEAPALAIDSLSKTAAEFLLWITSISNRGKVARGDLYNDPEGRYTLAETLSSMGLLRSDADGKLVPTARGWKIVDVLRQQFVLRTLLQCDNEAASVDDLSKRLSVEYREIEQIMMELKPYGYINVLAGNKRKLTEEGRRFAQRLPW